MIGPWRLPGKAHRRRAGDHGRSLQLLRERSLAIRIRAAAVAARAGGRNPGPDGHRVDPGQGRRRRPGGECVRARRGCVADSRLRFDGCAASCHRAEGRGSCGVRRGVRDGDRLAGRYACRARPANARLSRLTREGAWLGSWPVKRITGSGVRLHQAATPAIYAPDWPALGDKSQSLLVGYDAAGLHDTLVIRSGALARRARSSAPSRTGPSASSRSRSRRGSSPFPAPTASW